MPVIRYVGGDLGIRLRVVPAASDVEEAVIGHVKVAGLPATALPAYRTDPRGGLGTVAAAIG
jgi:hypothetical protein